jgi:outer membrane protein TolC
MHSRANHVRCLSFAVASVLTAMASTAFALQPLEEFLRGARTANPRNKEAQATLMQRTAEADVSTARLYPALTASGTYTRNQYEIALALPPALGGTGQTIVIQPQNQLDAAVTLTVPIVDVGAWERRAAAKAAADVASASQAATSLEIEKGVVRAYYQLVGQDAVHEAARRSLEVMRKNETLVRDRRASGTASELDVQRSVAEVARAEGDVASAELAVINARRLLATGTYVEPAPSSEFPTDDLHEETALAGWLAAAAKTPDVVSARAARRSAEKAADAAEASWLPTLSGSAQERFTNATAFSGRNSLYLLQLTLAWRLDATLPANVRAFHAVAAGSVARAERAERDAEDAVFQSWHQIGANIKRARAARAQLSAAKFAAQLAADRYAGGVATQLEVTQAQQDAFRAEVSRIQADTDIAYARAALRLSSGRPIGAVVP